jgi:hypothetical protein
MPPAEVARARHDGVCPDRDAGPIGSQGSPTRPCLSATGPAAARPCVIRDPGARRSTCLSSRCRAERALGECRARRRGSPCCVALGRGDRSLVVGTQIESAGGLGERIGRLAAGPLPVRQAAPLTLEDIVPFKANQDRHLVSLLRDMTAKRLLVLAHSNGRPGDPRVISNWCDEGHCPR